LGAQAPRVNVVSTDMMTAPFNTAARRAGWAERPNDTGSVNARYCKQTERMRQLDTECTRTAMTPAHDIIEQVASKAAQLLARGRRPRVVRVGRTQSAALDRLGHTGDTLTVPAPHGPAQIIAHAGQTNATSRFDEVTLRVERTDAIDELTLR
jgi:hypothetical protein